MDTDREVTESFEKLLNETEQRTEDELSRFKEMRSAARRTFGPHPTEEQFLTFFRSSDPTSSSEPDSVHKTERHTSPNAESQLYTGPELQPYAGGLSRHAALVRQFSMESSPTKPERRHSSFRYGGVGSFTFLDEEIWQLNVLLDQLVEQGIDPALIQTVLGNVKQALISVVRRDLKQAAALLAELAVAAQSASEQPQQGQKKVAEGLVHPPKRSPD